MNELLNVYQVGARWTFDIGDFYSGSVYETEADARSAGEAVLATMERFGR